MSNVFRGRVGVCVLNRIRKVSVGGVFNLADSSEVSRRFGMNTYVRSKS